MRIGIVGKTNVGKTTFFNAATLLNAKISTYPFTTKSPAYGMAYVQTPCVCREFGVKDKPKNSACIEGWRFIPLQIMDLPGLIEGAHLGRGLGIQFLRVAMTSDVLLHVVDASGSVDQDGKICEPGKGDPIRDYDETEKELVLWFKKFLEQKNKRVVRLTRSKKLDLPTALESVLSGAKIDRRTISESLEASELAEREFSRWNDNDLERFASVLRSKAKPTLIVANKMDLPSAERNYTELMRKLGSRFIVPCSADAELALRRAEKAGLIRYVPGEEKFEIVNEQKLSDRQKMALSYVSDKVIEKWLRTGVQFAINFAIFKLLGMNVIYPVSDERKYSDKHGNILPDAYLMAPSSSTEALARRIHSELARTFIFAMDVRTGLRLPESYVLRDRDVIKIVAAGRK